MPAVYCWEALELVAPLRDSLCLVLGLPKTTWNGPPPRVAQSNAMVYPSDRDLCKLLEDSVHLCGALGKMRQHICVEDPHAASGDATNVLKQEDSVRTGDSSFVLPHVAASSPGPRTPRTLSSSAKTPGEADWSPTLSSEKDGSPRSRAQRLEEAYQQLLAQSKTDESRKPVSPVTPGDAPETERWDCDGVPVNLEERCEVLRTRAGELESWTSRRRCELEGVVKQLHRHVRELEGPAARVHDLEKVVLQLRGRVSELETREARVVELREECASLRMHIAELVGSIAEEDSLRSQRDELRTKLAELEM